MKQLKRQVEFCLQQYPISRNSDIALMIYVWQNFYDVQHEVTLKRLYDLPLHESVKRIRAQFNQKNQYLPTDPTVIKARAKNQKKWRQHLGYAIENVSPNQTSI